jgi:hypothetical protein
MTATPFISGSTGESVDSATIVTSTVSGNSDTGSVNDALLIAAWGQTMDEGTPTGEAFTNSFTLEGEIDANPGTSDHRAVVATRIVSSSGTYSTTYGRGGHPHCLLVRHL